MDKRHIPDVDKAADRLAACAGKSLRSASATSERVAGMYEALYAPEVQAVKPDLSSNPGAPSSCGNCLNFRTGHTPAALESEPPFAPPATEVAPDSERTRTSIGAAS